MLGELNKNAKSEAWAPSRINCGNFSFYKIIYNRNMECEKHKLRKTSITEVKMMWKSQLFRNKWDTSEWSALYQIVTWWLFKAWKTIWKERIVIILKKATTDYVLKYNPRKFFISVRISQCSVNLHVILLYTFITDAAEKDTEEFHDKL